MVIFISSKKKDQYENMRENDAQKTIRVAFQEVFPRNFQEKEHLEWEATFQHGPILHSMKLTASLPLKIG